MTFDEQGQAATLEGKVLICQRSYNLMRSKIEFIRGVVILIFDDDQQDDEDAEPWCKDRDAVALTGMIWMQRVSGRRI